jgi:hypothetical protein
VPLSMTIVAMGSAPWGEYAITINLRDMSRPNEIQATASDSFYVLAELPTDLVL